MSESNFPVDRGEKIPTLRPVTIQDFKQELEQILEEAQRDRSYVDGKITAYEHVVSLLNRQT